MTEQQIYDKHCVGCPAEQECHENCEVCDMIAEELEKCEETVMKGKKNGKV